MYRGNCSAPFVAKAKKSTAGLPASRAITYIVDCGDFLLASGGSNSAWEVLLLVIKAMKASTESELATDACSTPSGYVRSLICQARVRDPESSANSGRGNERRERPGETSIP